MAMRRVDELKPHPRNASIYGGCEDERLTQSVKEHGVLTPLLVSYDDRIIGGHRRWTAARAAGLEEVAVVVFPSKEELDILEAVLENNRQREKTPEMKCREAEAFAEIEEERAKIRRTSGLLNGRSVPQLVAERKTDAGDTRQKVAVQLGISHQTAQKAIVVGKALTRLESSDDYGDQQQAKQIKKVLNDRGIIPAAALIPRPVAVKSASPGPAYKPVAKFNETNEKVDWARWTWNPVTGCLHDCPYCYARDIAERFYPQGFKPTFIPDRLSAPRNTKVPDEHIDEKEWHRVFTCSMADLFGKWVPQEWIDAVFEQVRDNQQWEFLFLTKFPQRLAEIDWPENAWVGTTVDRQYRVDIAEKAFRGVKAGVKWLSCEPMLEPLKFGSLEMFDWVVIGGASRSSQTSEFWPPLEWVFDLWQQARNAGCNIWIKPNGISGLTQCPREMPRSRQE